MAEKKRLNIEEITAAVTKRFGKGSVFTLNGDSLEAVPVIPTGSPSLDSALGVMGYPRGRIIELFGQESSGKTSLALLAVAQAQLAGGIVAYIDAEHALDPQHAQRIGVDIDSLLLSQPECAEDALNLVDFYLREHMVDLVVIDSVAALVPKVELEGAIGDSHMGLHARIMSQTMRKINASASDTDCAILFINQTRQKIGVVFGNPETTTGGNALKFYSTVRLQVSRGKTLKVKEESVGIIINVKVVKNKVAPPFKKAEAYLFFNRGFDPVYECLNSWVDAGLVEKSGTWYSYKGESIGQGIPGVSEYFRNNPVALSEILSEHVKYRAELMDTEEDIELDTE